MRWSCCTNGWLMSNRWRRQVPHINDVLTCVCVCVRLCVWVCRSCGKRDGTCLRPFYSWFVYYYHISQRWASVHCESPSKRIKYKNIKLQVLSVKCTYLAFVHCSGPKKARWRYTKILCRFESTSISCPIRGFCHVNSRTRGLSPGTLHFRSRKNGLSRERKESRRDVCTVEFHRALWVVCHYTSTGLVATVLMSTASWWNCFL